MLSDQIIFGHSEVVRRSDFLALSSREASRLWDASWRCLYEVYIPHTAENAGIATPRDLGTPLKLLYGSCEAFCGDVTPTHAVGALFMS